MPHSFWGSMLRTGAASSKPSSLRWSPGKEPCHTFMRPEPSASRSPHGKDRPRRPARAAVSHSASVGSRAAAPYRHAQKAIASAQVTCTTGWSSSQAEPRPAGRSQLAPSTAIHHGASTALWSWRSRSSGGSASWKTKDHPKIASASLRYPVSSSNSRNCALLASYTPIAKPSSRTRRSGPSPSAPPSSGLAVPTWYAPPGT